MATSCWTWKLCSYAQQSSDQIEKMTSFLQSEAPDFPPFVGCIDIVELAMTLVCGR